MTPVIELEDRSRGAGDPRPGSLRPAAERLAAVLGNDAFYLDILPSRRTRLGVSRRLHAAAHAEMRRRGLRFVPVYTVGASNHVAAVSAAVTQDQRGVALRYRAVLEPTHIGRGGVQELLAAELVGLDVRPSDADLIVDLGGYGRTRCSSRAMSLS